MTNTETGQRMNTRLLAALAYLAVIVGANIAVSKIGVVPVGFGLMAPAAVYFVGAALVLRDVVHEFFGYKVVLVLIVVGAVLSALTASPLVALASALAFGCSEIADTFVYAAARQRYGMAVAVLVSGIPSLILDSLVFLAVAFGSFTYLPGQIMGKTVATLVGAALVFAWRRGR